MNLTDPNVRAEEVAKAVRWGNLIKKCGGSVAVLGPNNVKRPAYVFSEHKTNIVAALNEIAQALDGIGVVGVLHQHTGTCVETRDETYAVMEAVNTRYVKFGPDVGQLQKGGSDPVKVVKDFLPTIRHVHMKDFDGGEHYLGYAPLGLGKVDIAGLCDLLESSGNDLDDHGGAGSVQRAAAYAARGRADQQGDDAEAGIHVPVTLGVRSHSRSATMGSTCAARRAGPAMAAAATRPSMPTVAQRIQGSNNLTPNVSALTARPAANAATSPRTIPATTSRPPWPTISRRTADGRAPSAIRTPISADDR